MTESDKRKQRKFLEEYIKTLDIQRAMAAAGYPKRTAAMIVQNLLESPKTKRELKALCESKADHLEICKGFIILNYLKILDWAASLDDNSAPMNAALALKALEGITKQLEKDFSGENESGKNTEKQPIIPVIKGLDPDKM